MVPGTLFIYEVILLAADSIESGTTYP